MLLNKRRKTLFSRSGGASHPQLLSTMSGETLVYLALLVLIALAGFNSGNNLLYLIGGVMLGALVVSLIAGRVNLKGLSVNRRAPSYAVAGHPFRVTVEIANEKRFFGSFGVTLRRMAEGSGGSYFLAIPRGSIQRREIEMSLPHRGLHEFPPISLSSRFPWGLFKLNRAVSDGHQIVVYPGIFDLTKSVPGRGHLQDEFSQHLKGPGSGLYGVREYRHGEEAANICWKLSAKLNRLIIRETECEERRRVCIFFDNALTDRSESSLATFERAVSAAASLVWYLCRNGYSLKLVTRDKVVGYGDGLDHMHRMLITLAMVEPVGPEEKRGATLHKNIFEGGAGVLVTRDNGTVTIRSTDGDFGLVLDEKIRGGPA